MNKILRLFCMAMVSFVIASCSNEEDLQSPAIRDYQTDAQILSKFVDVNKTIGEYYINENKKLSALSYITDADWQELQQVNPANKAKFESDLTALNAQLAIAAQRTDVSQIVFNTYGETYIKEIDHNSPITITKSTPEETRATRSNYGRLSLLYNSEQQISFYSGNQIRTKIDINLYSYTYYFFEIICETNASKTGSSAGGSNPKTIVMSGSTMMETWEFTWKENTGSSNVFWKFRGKRSAPQASMPQITAEFSN